MSEPVATTAAPPAPYAFADPRALLAAAEGARAPVTFPSEGATQHFQFYEDPAVIDGAVDEIDAGFAAHLASAAPEPPVA
jgi:hypothetical protein